MVDVSPWDLSGAQNLWIKPGTTSTGGEVCCTGPRSTSYENCRPSPPLVVGFLSPITCKATYCRTFLQDDSPGLSLKQFSFIQICRCWCISYGCCRWCDGYPWWRHPNWKGQGAQWIHHGIRFFWLHGDKLREMTCRNAMVVKRDCRFPSCQLPEFEMKPWRKKHHASVIEKQTEVVTIVFPSKTLTLPRCFVRYVFTVSRDNLGAQVGSSWNTHRA